MRLIPANAQTQLTKDGSDYRLTLSSGVLARDVYVTLETWMQRSPTTILTCFLASRR